MRAPFFLEFSQILAPIYTMPDNALKRSTVNLDQSVGRVT